MNDNYDPDKRVKRLLWWVVAMMAGAQAGFGLWLAWSDAPWPIGGKSVVILIVVIVFCLAAWLIVKGASDKNI